MSEISSNKRVAKNAIALTVRMVLVTIVGLYTSRIVLEVLGVDDYGIYGVIGGVVGMAGFLNASMAGATSRFITVELGRGNKESLQRIFSTALIIHIILAFVIIIGAETIGLWFVNNKMNFPPERMYAVNVLFQFTIVSLLFGVTQAPYTALIVAHEKFSIYAYFEIVSVLLKLLIVYLLLIINTDRLILYSGLTTSVSIFMALAYRVYCIRHFKESRFKLIFERKVMREMLTFSGYDLYGNLCVTAKMQGMPIILNIFFGVVANAGATIANTVTNVLKGFSMTVITAFRPQITKLYASDNLVLMMQIMRRSIQFTLLVFGYFAIPVFLETGILLKLWLGQIPPYSIEFLRLIMIAYIFDIIAVVNNSGIHATGNIKNISFISGTFYLLIPVGSWLVLKYIILSPIIVYIADIFLFIIVACLGLYFLIKQIPSFGIAEYASGIVKSILSLFFSLLIASFIAELPIFNLDDDILSQVIQLTLVTIINLIVLTLTTYFLAFNKSEKNYIISFIKKKLRLGNGKKDF